MNDSISAKDARQALIDLPDETQGRGQPPLNQIYIPKSHVRAIRPECVLVTGMRGAGKTFWWWALQSENARQLLGQHPDLSMLREETEVQIGFGDVEDNDNYPSKRVLKSLIGRGFDPQDIWRTVLAWKIAPDNHPLSGEKWIDRVQFVTENVEDVDRMFEEQDSRFDQQDRDFLILFDALDLCADDWNTAYPIIRGLLQEALLGQSYKRIHMKIFLRSDQFEERKIADFPDASKILRSKVELSWPPNQLYALLWHHLGNSETNGRQFQKFLYDGKWKKSIIDGHLLFSVPHELRFDDDIQRDKFNAMAGERMGAGPKRGRPYTWIPNHLADTQGKVSPRSFLAALHAAAENTRDKHRDHDCALHYDSIKFGVQEASMIRRDELREDYPWVDELLEPLRGKSVPCDFDEITKCWEKNKIISSLVQRIEAEKVKLPPVHINEGPEGVRWDLESLGVFQRMLDGRVNIPDVFRVAYGLGRKGGVKPVR